MDQAVTIFLSVFGGGALVSFVQYLITRHDAKDKAYKDILAAVDGIRADVNKLRDDVAEDKATNSRIRILKFSDEVSHGVRHSEEMFNQSLQDIDSYKRYCNAHPNYENNKAKLAMANIERAYQHCLNENDFLE